MNLFSPKIIDRNRFNDYSQLSLTFLAIAIFIIFAIRPSLVKAYSLYNDFKHYQELNTVLETKVKNLESFDRLKTTNPKIFELINKALPEVRDEAALITSLNLIASEEFVTLRSITIGNEGANIEGANTIDIVVDVEGNYEDIMEFISTLSNSQRIMTVESVDLSQNANQVSYFANVKVKAYFTTQPL